MKPILAIGLAAVLGCAPLTAAPSARNQAIERIVNAVMPSSKMKEMFNQATDVIVDKLAREQKLPPRCREDMRTALRGFMTKLVDEGVLIKMMASQFRHKLTDEELVTLV